MSDHNSRKVPHLGYYVRMCIDLTKTIMADAVDFLANIYAFPPSCLLTERQFCWEQSWVRTWLCAIISLSLFLLQLLWQLGLVTRGRYGQWDISKFLLRNLLGKLLLSREEEADAAGTTSPLLSALNTDLKYRAVSASFRPCSKSNTEITRKSTSFIFKPLSFKLSVIYTNESLRWHHNKERFKCRSGHLSLTRGRLHAQVISRDSLMTDLKILS